MRADRRIRFLIHDGAAQFAGAFDNVFRSDDTTIIRTAPYTPIANAFAERWVGTARRELCDRTLIWNHRHLEQLLREYIEHYDAHRRTARLVTARNDTEVVEYRPGRPIRRHAACNGLVDEYCQSSLSSRHRPTRHGDVNLDAPAPPALTSDITPTTTSAHAIAVPAPTRWSCDCAGDAVQTPRRQTRVLSAMFQVRLRSSRSISVAALNAMRSSPFAAGAGAQHQ
jgi:hypothetical protein